MQYTLAGERCSKCGGQVLRRWYGPACFQCSWEPGERPVLGKSVEPRLPTFGRGDTEAR